VRKQELMEVRFLLYEKPTLNTGTVARKHENCPNRNPDQIFVAGRGGSSGVMWSANWRTVAHKLSQAQYCLFATRISCRGAYFT